MIEKTAEVDVVTHSFKPGDLVLLKSGGPGMTVIDVGLKGMIYCRWMNESGPCEASFPANTLRETDPRELANLKNGW